MSLYRFRINLSDIDKSVYETLDFRLAMHPSESFEFLLTRMFAYCLSYDRDLQFSAGGLSNPDEAALSVADPMGGFKLLIEIGNPSERRLHKASKAAKRVHIYTYKNPEVLRQEVRAGDIHAKDRLEAFSIDSDLLAKLELLLKKDNSWSILRDSGSLLVSADGEAWEGEIIPINF